MFAVGNSNHLDSGQFVRTYKTMLYSKFRAFISANQSSSSFDAITLDAGKKTNLYSVGRDSVDRGSRLLLCS